MNSQPKVLATWNLLHTGGFLLANGEKWPEAVRANLDLDLDAVPPPRRLQRLDAGGLLKTALSSAWDASYGNPSRPDTRARVPAAPLRDRAEPEKSD